MYCVNTVHDFIKSIWIVIVKEGNLYGTEKCFSMYVSLLSWLVESYDQVRVKLHVYFEQIFSPCTFSSYFSSYVLSLNKCIFMQAGLLTSYILKALCFGRYVKFLTKYDFQMKFWVNVNKFVSAYAFRHSSVREIAVMILMAYLSYMLAEVLEGSS